MKRPQYLVPRMAAWILRFHCIKSYCSHKYADFLLPPGEVSSHLIFINPLSVIGANPWDVSDPLFQIPLSITCFFCHLPQPTTNDNFGGRNNVITVKKSDFEDFEALDCDANASVCSGSTSEYSTLWIYIHVVYHKLQDLLSTGFLFHRVLSGGLYSGPFKHWVPIS